MFQAHPTKEQIIHSKTNRHPHPHPVSAQPLLFELFEESSAIFIILTHQNSFYR